MTALKDPHTIVVVGRWDLNLSHSGDITRSLSLFLKFQILSIQKNVGASGNEWAISNARIITN
jgi:hypothetical protein